MAAADHNPVHHWIKKTWNLVWCLQFLRWYSTAALKLKASISAVSCNVRVLPTLLISIPSVVMPTLSSGCSRIPRSIMSARILKFKIVTSILTHNTTLIPACIFTLVLFHQFPVFIPKQIIGVYEELKSKWRHKALLSMMDSKPSITITNDSSPVQPQSYKR